MRSALTACLLAIAVPSRAIITQVGTTSADFLRLGAGARALGMGEAAAAVADGPDAIYWNPAGLAAMDRPEVLYSRSELPAGVHNDFLSAAAPVKFLGGTVAIAFTHLSQESLALVTATNQTVGSFSPHSEAYSFAYARGFSQDGSGGRSRDYFRESWNLPRVDRPYEDNPEMWMGELAVGLSVKGISETLGTRTASSFAVDAGVLFRPAELQELILAAALRNAGEKIRFIADAEPLPLEGAVGLAWQAPAGEWTLLPAFEADMPYAGQGYGKLGFEASRRVAAGMSAALRVGYDSRSAVDLGPISGLTSGVGLQAGGFKFDAAFQPMGLLGESFRLSAGWKF